MPGSHLKDREVELLLAGSATGSADLAGLEEFVEALASDIEAPRDVPYMATSLAAVARDSGRPAKSGIRRLAVVMASTAMLIGLSGVAMAANGSAPGDALYGLDRALERIGIGDGGMEERVQEFDALLERGEENEAFEFLSDVVNDGTGPETAEAARRLQDETSVDSGSSQAGTPAEASDQGPAGEENAANRSIAPVTEPDTTSAADDTGGANGEGKAVGQDEDTDPPGQEKKEDTDQIDANESNSTPQDDEPETSGQGHAVGQDDDTDPPGQDTESPSQENEPPGQEKPKENNGQGNANGPDQNSGNPQGNGPDQNNGNPQNDNDPPGQN